MKEIIAIEVKHNPLSPERECDDLTVHDVQKLDESYYTVGFQANVLIDVSDWASIYNFKKIKDQVWEFCKVDDAVTEDVLIGEIQQFVGTFENALIHLLSELKDEEYHKESIDRVYETPGLRDIIDEEIQEKKTTKQPMEDTNVKKTQWGKIILTIIVLIIWAVSCSRMCSGPDWGWDSF